MPPIDPGLPSQEIRFAKSIIQLMCKLLPNTINSDTKESELVTRYTDHFYVVYLMTCT